MELLDISVDLLKYALEQKGFDWIPNLHKTFFDETVPNTVRTEVKNFLFRFPVPVFGASLPGYFDLNLTEDYARLIFLGVVEVEEGNPSLDRHAMILRVMQRAASMAYYFSTSPYNHQVIYEIAKCLASVLQSYEDWLKSREISWDDLGVRCCLITLKHAT